MYLAKYEGREWSYWFTGHPDDDSRVLCLTKTKNGSHNMVLGYWDPDAGRWYCGMNSNVIAWKRLPDIPEV